MRKVNYITIDGMLTRLLLLSSLIVATLLPGYSQNEQTGGMDEGLKDTTAIADQEPIEKKKLRLGIDAFKINTDIKLQASAKFKVEGRFQNVAGVEVSFFAGEDSESGTLLGRVVTNRQGKASLLVQASQVANSTEPHSYIAVVQNDPEYKDAEDMISVSPSIMEMTLKEADSVRTVDIFLGYPDETGQIQPVPEASCQLYVKRLFGLLPVGEMETTDEEGRISFTFPNDIKGDQAGKVIVIARVEEQEIVGNVEANQTVAWGIPTKKNDFYLQRELWSARANSPILLVIVVNAVLLGVWGTIAFIFLEILRINRLGKVE